jgi:hypothetical protein
MDLIRILGDAQRCGIDEKIASGVLDEYDKAGY